MARLRVVLLIPTLDQSGAERQLTLLATGLPRAEFDVHVLALTRGGPFEAELRSGDIPVTILGKRCKVDPVTWWSLRQHLAAIKPDILHTWLFAANSYGRLAVPKQTRVLVSERCVDEWKAGWQHWIDRQLWKRTDWLSGNSQAVVDFYTARGMRASRTSVIPNGVVPPEINPDDRNRIRERCGIPADAFVLGYVGRLASQKRLEDLIWATETLRQIRPKLHLLLVGAGPLRERLERMAMDLQVTQHVHFVGHQTAAGPWFSAMDAFCLASQFEGLSNSLMEAMSAGLPVLASDIAPNQELIVHESNGMLFPVRDTVALMQRLRQFIDEPERCQTLGLAAAATMRDSFSVSAMVSRYAELYQKLADTTHSPGQPAHPPGSA